MGGGGEGRKGGDTHTYKNNALMSNGFADKQSVYQEQLLTD